MKTTEGHLLAEGLRFGIVISRFNELISSRLLSGALDILRRHGVGEDDIELAWAPGSFEVPMVAKTLAETGRFDAIICLGAIIRGGTPHFDYIANEAAKGIAQVNLATGVPTIFGMITADTIDQAIERAGTKAGNKGADAARTAIEMANLLGALKEDSPPRKS
jgi:6,7-dimethyl-8-ribityllumazine synthase